MAAQSCVLLLRGINVGGRHILPMAALRKLLADELGCSEVQTYVQSGNVVCTAPLTLNASRVALALEQRFGFSVPVVLRTAAEWRALVAANPFLAHEADLAFLHVVCFAEPPSPENIARLNTLSTGDEQIALSGRELYLLLPHGVGRSKLALGVTAPGISGAPTMRNWRTVMALAAMLKAVVSAS